MKKLIASSALGAVMMVSTVSGAFAQTGLPEPGTPGCKGQATKVIAQLGKNNPELIEARGIGGVVRFVNEQGLPITVQELQEAIRAYCEGELSN